MKTTITRSMEKVFQGTAILSLSALMLISTDVAAQQQEVPFISQKAVSVAAKWQANIFPSFDPMILKIVFSNPAKEPVTLIVRKADREIVYKKVIGTIEIYNSRLDVSHLPDGVYTFEIGSKKQRFSQTFEIFTQTARLTHVQ